MRKIFGLILVLIAGAHAATSALYLHHERSTQANVEADCQNREICLDKTNLAPIGRFNDGTLWHGVTQEKPNVNLTGALSVTGSTVLSNSLTLSLFSAGRIPYTTTAGLLTSGTGLTYNGSAFSVTGAAALSSTLDVTGNVHTSGTGTGFWMNPLGTFTYGMYTSGTNLLFRSGSTTPFLTVNSSGQPTFSTAVTGTSSGSGSSSAFTASSAAPTLAWNSTGSGADAKNWDIQASGNSLAFRTRTDANLSGTDWLTVTRSGTSVSSVQVLAPVTSNSAYTTGIFNAEASGTPYFIGQDGGTIKYSLAPTLFNVTVPTTMTSTLGVTGNTGIGGSTSAGIGLFVQSSALTGTQQRGIQVEPTFSSGATVSGYASTFKVTNSGSFTMPNAVGVHIQTASPGSSTITNAIGLDVATQTGGTNNYAIRTGASGLIQLGSLTASSAVATDASKNLISVTNTGTGNNVLSASPTLTGTINAANQTLSGTLGVTGVTTATGGLNLPTTTASLPLFTDGSKNAVSNAMTGTGSVMMSASPTTTGTLTAAAITASGLITANGGIQSVASVASSFYETGSFTASLSGFASCTGGTFSSGSCLAIANYVKVGKIVSVVIPQLYGTSNSTSCTLSGFPSQILPARLQLVPIVDVINNSIVTNGAIEMSSLDVNRLHYYLGGAPANSFTSSGSKGMGQTTGQQTLTYSLQ